MRLQTPDQKKSRQPVFGEVLTELERHRFLYRQRCSNGFVFLQLEVLIIIVGGGGGGAGGGGGGWGGGGWVVFVFFFFYTPPPPLKYPGWKEKH